MPVVRTDGRAGWGRCTVTRLPNFLGWVDLLTHGAPQARFARQSSAIKMLGVARQSVNLRRFRFNVCTVCAQVIQSWGRGFHSGPSSGLLLFNIFINDLNYAVPDVSLRLNADDTTLYASDVSPIALQFVVNRVSAPCQSGSMQTICW